MSKTSAAQKKGKTKREDEHQIVFHLAGSSREYRGSASYPSRWFAESGYCSLISSLDTPFNISWIWRFWNKLLEPDRWEGAVNSSNEPNLSQDHDILQAYTMKRTSLSHQWSGSRISIFAHIVPRFYIHLYCLPIAYYPHIFYFLCLNALLVVLASGMRKWCKQGWTKYIEPTHFRNIIYHNEFSNPYIG